jgi:NADH:ubiquinone oxidoreductase subunit 2 (subunit N)
MLLVISSYDLISLYLAIELQSLSFYVITAFQRNNEFSIEAGLKYFILGALSSGFLLFGESLIYGFTGITNFEELAKYFTLNSLVIQETSLFGTSAAISLGLLFILVAFLFKIGAVPFHM